MHWKKDTPPSTEGWLTVLQESTPEATRMTLETRWLQSWLNNDQSKRSKQTSWCLDHNVYHHKNHGASSSPQKKVLAISWGDWHSIGGTRYMSYVRNYFFGENAITKCGGSPIGFAALEYGLWGIGFGGSPVGYEGSLNRFKVQGNFLLLCSSTNFVGYSYRFFRFCMKKETGFCINFNQLTWSLLYLPPSLKKTGEVPSF